MGRAELPLCPNLHPASPSDVPRRYGKTTLFSFLQEFRFGRCSVFQFKTTKTQVRVRVAKRFEKLR